MSTSWRALVLLALTFAVAHSENQKVRYDGYRLLRVHPETPEHIAALRDLMNDRELDFWMEPSSPGHPVDILVSPKKLASVRSFLNHLSTEVLMDDVQSLINEDAQLESFFYAGSSSSFDWQDYHTIDSINEWLKQKAIENNNIATIITAGKSTEGRELTGLRIAHTANLPIVFVEAGIHAREWISPATATWFIEQALNTSASDIIKSYEWHVFPSVNPDGYAYTQKDRLWRKTRSRDWTFCTGVDANRNWPFKWEGGWFSCTESYPGGKPASEPETQGLMKYINGVASRTRVYISLHSYSQLLMYPWGYTSDLPDGHKRFDEIAKKAVTKLQQVFGTSYRYGPISTTIYPAFGSTIDYAYSLNITYPFVFELRDEGRHGFLLPPEQIIPTAQETLEGLKVILEEAEK